MDSVEREKYLKYKTELIEKVAIILDEEAEVIEKTVIKNGVSKDVLFLKSDLTPVFCINDLWDDGIPVEDAVDIIVSKYYVTKNNKNLSADINEYFKKDSLFFRLISINGNEDFLKEVPHRKLGDTGMAVYYSCLKKNNETSMVAIINNKMMGVIADEENALYEIAYDNTDKIIKPVLKTLTGVLLKSKENFLKDDSPVFLSEPMVLTGEDNFMGSALILYKHILDAIYNKLGEFYIIPSSIHEVLIVQKKFPLDFLKETLVSVNDSIVADNERLSDEVFLYDGNLSIAVN